MTPSSPWRLPWSDEAWQPQTCLGIPSGLVGGAPVEKSYRECLAHASRNDRKKDEPNHLFTDLKLCEQMVQSPSQIPTEKRKGWL